MFYSPLGAKFYSECVNFSERPFLEDDMVVTLLFPLLLVITSYLELQMSFGGVWRHSSKGLPEKRKDILLNCLS
jgi:hypothetical protein